jgi:hypothetical protein
VVARTNKLGVKGVHQEKDGRYATAVQFQGDHIFIGRFTTLEGAKAAHTEIASSLAGEYFRA